MTGSEFRVAPALGRGDKGKEKKEEAPMGPLLFRARKGVRSLDIDLGKVAIYQLSYSRESFPNLIKKRTL